MNEEEQRRYALLGCENYVPTKLPPESGTSINEVLRWILGLAFSLVLGAYGYAYSVGNSAHNERIELEARIMRQLDVIERKVDRVLESQYNEKRR